MNVEAFDGARRLAFIFSRTARALGIPPTSDTQLLLETAMQNPEAVSPDDYAIIFKIHTHRSAA